MINKKVLTEILHWKNKSGDDIMEKEYELQKTLLYIGKEGSLNWCNNR